MKAPLAILALAPIAAIALGGCADDEVDCAQVCAAYEDCVSPPGFDATDCIDRCNAFAKDDDDFQERLETCGRCVEVDSCDGSDFRCDADCSGVLFEVLLDAP